MSLFAGVFFAETAARQRVVHKGGFDTRHREHPRNVGPRCAALRKLFPGQEFRAVARSVKHPPYAIPYRCLYSRSVPNLFMAGRNISVTHVALGTVRVQRTTGMMGEVLGMAAALCTQHQTTPRGVFQNHLAPLQELMRLGVGRPGRNQVGWVSDPT